MNTSNKTTDNGTMKPNTMATTVTPKQLSIALHEDVIHRFLAEVKNEIDLVEQHNAGLEFLKIGSRKKVAGMYTRILKHYQLAFPWLKPHLISYYLKKQIQKCQQRKRRSSYLQDQHLPKMMIARSCQLMTVPVAPSMHVMVQMQLRLIVVVMPVVLLLVCGTPDDISTCSTGIDDDDAGDDSLYTITNMTGRNKRCLWVPFFKMLLFRFVKIQSIAFLMSHHWPTSDIISRSSDTPNMTPLVPFLVASKRRSRDIRIFKKGSMRHAYRSSRRKMSVPTVRPNATIDTIDTNSRRTIHPNAT
jgi:hypothetical protein